jgi:histidine triad (HIT) family protein
MVDEQCIFCKIVAGQIPSTKIYEDQAVFAFLDVNPVSDGHTLVVPKEHFEKLHDCPAEVLTKAAVPLGKIAKAVCDATDAEGYNVLCNNGKSAGQLVGHLHFHIIPRRGNDGVFDKWPAYKYEPGKIEQIGRKICENLSGQIESI